MQEGPIFFIAPMVRAVRSDSKTQTRRVCKARRDRSIGCELAPHELAGEVNGGDYRNAPYAPGDRLTVRETFYAFGRWEKRHSAKKGRDEWHFLDMTLECDRVYQHAADGNPQMPVQGRRHTGVEPGWWKRPAIFMPRAARRISLEIAAVRIERLRDITPDDCIAEGAWRIEDKALGRGHEAVAAYEALWEQINGAGSWAVNPWVWVIDFRRLAA